MTEIFKPREYNNVVSPSFQDEIYNYLTDINFDWHFMEDTTNEVANPLTASIPSFGNLIYYPNKDNPHLDFFKPLLEGLEQAGNFKIIDLLRIRVGFLLNTRYPLPNMPYKHNTPHRDFEQEHYVAVYYVNKADGETVVFRETEASEKYNILHKSMPEKGKAVLFNGWHYHASTCPKMHNKRIAITINFTADIKNG
jgi:hypothetical protein